MGYLVGREWDQSVFGSWARDTGGQTSSRRISGDPITTSTSAAWFTSKYQTWFVTSRTIWNKSGGLGNTDKVQARTKLFRTLFEIKDIEFLLTARLGVYSLFFMFQSESFNFDDFTSQPVFMSCPLEIYSYFHFCVRVQSPCPDFPLRLSFLMTLRCPGPGMSCNSRDCESLVVIFDNI